jgi:aquaporin Z
MTASLRAHWPEYLMEAAELGLFMVSACVVVALLEHPGSPVRAVIPAPLVRRALVGLAMGLTAIAIVYSPLGKRSGAHFNPSVTLTFFRLGKVAPWDALFYVAAQFAGALAGVTLAAAGLRTLIADPSVNYAATQPGPAGDGVAFVAEAAISFGMMTLVLVATNTPRVARFTGLLAGALVAAYITLEAPLSGMSMNPARTLGSAIPATLTHALWIYFTAPPLGMLLAAEVYLRRGRRGVHCAKLHHDNPARCIFCEYRASRGRRDA